MESIHTMEYNLAINTNKLLTHVATSHLQGIRLKGKKLIPKGHILYDFILMTALGPSFTAFSDASVGRKQLAA